FICSKRSDKLRGRILLVISHPDDECMFFGPAILKLLANHEVFVLCFSVGDAYGLGNVREKELLSALQYLGVNIANVSIINDSRFKDGMDEKWNINSVSNIIEQLVIAKQIGTIVTFDKKGITNHANHISVYEGARNLRSTEKVDLFVLDSVNVFRKFLSILEIPLLFMDFSRVNKEKKVFVLTFSEYQRLLTALRKHSSQMVWFRILYSYFSRYMFINTLSRVNI
ncbi:N-acetylglucosaminyl-phosphatidylinositol de-N-acetylase-like protein, partial [Leptotrombidium deliense]